MGVAGITAGTCGVIGPAPLISDFLIIIINLQLYALIRRRISALMGPDIRLSII